VSTVTELHPRLEGDTPILHSQRAAKPWSPAKLTRVPFLPAEALKLRDADIFIIDDRCKGCSFCIEFCPRDVLEPSKKVNQIGVHPPQVRDSSVCVGCGICEDICPDFAIFLTDRGKPRSKDE